MKTDHLPGRAAQGLPYRHDPNASWNTQHNNVLGSYRRTYAASRPAKSRKNRRQR